MTALFGQTRYGYVAVTGPHGGKGWQAYDHETHDYTGPVHYTRRAAEDWVLALVREDEHARGES